MGSFISTDWVLQVDDRVLTHLEYVIVRQFRRGGSFLVTWIDGTGDDAAERSLWLGPTIPVGFEFDGADPVPLETAWISALSAAAGSTEGLRIIDADGRDVDVPTRLRRSVDSARATEHLNG